MYKIVNFEKAKKMGISCEQYIVMLHNQDQFDDFISYYEKRGYTHNLVYNNGLFLVNVPRKRGNKHLTRTGGGLSLWGSVFRGIGLLYEDYKQFISDREEEERNETI